MSGLGSETEFPFDYEDESGGQTMPANMDFQRNPEVLKEWGPRAETLERGSRFLVAVALLDDTFTSRREAAQWFQSRGCSLGSVEAQGTLVVSKI
jgi:hypothetical protein